MDATGGRGVEPRHIPVFTERVLALFEPAMRVPDAVLVDATVGLGGHTQALLDTYGHIQVIGLDRDTRALDHARHRLAGYGPRIRLVHAVYDELPAVLDRLGLPAVHGVLFDLGVSSMQLDEAGRGFAYARDAPLDMRMDATTGQTAADVLNTYSVDELTRILREYGQERFARRISQAVVRERAARPFDMSARLVELVRSAIPAATRRTGGHPAKRTFQALRIEVNAELAVLSRAVPAALAALAVGGRIVVLSYQSLEDRIVKRALAAGASSTAPPELPVVPVEHLPQLRLLTRGAELPDAAEVAANPRAASVRLRAAERIRAAA
jgi:16S rRNA (cytosine1402-N4)-methyltransferase